MNIGKYVELLGQLFEAAYIIDPQRTLLFWNKSAETLTGYEASSLVGKKCEAIASLHVNERGEKLCKSHCPLQQALAEHKKTERLAYVQHKLGHRLPVTARLLPITNDDGALIGTIEIFINNAQAENSKPGVINELVKAAYIDSVTNLPNREYMENKIKKNLAESAKRPYDVALGLLLIEVQNLRDFNQRGGIAAGNGLLKLAAKILTLNAEAEAGCIVCKWYGGSFIVLMNTDRLSTLLNWAEKLKIQLEKAYLPGYEEEKIAVAIGGIAAQPGDTLQEVLQHLEAQLQTSKSKSNTVSIS